MTDTTMHTSPILVLGGTGKTGRRIAQRLIECGHQVRIGSRSGAPPFDWNDPESWEAALSGTQAAYISFQPDLAVPGALDAIEGFVALALKKGVRRLVLLSGRGEVDAEAAEDALKNSSADWTIIRASWFAQNFSEDLFLDAIRSGIVALPARDIGEPFIDVEDIADVATAALTEDGHAGKLYEVTGPERLTFKEAIAKIAEASGNPVRFEYVSAEEFTAMLQSAGLPDGMVGLLNYLFSTVLDGRNAHVVDGVEQALGRPPRTFSDFVRDVAHSGVWNKAA